MVGVKFEGVSSIAKRFFRVANSCRSCRFNFRFSFASFRFSSCVNRRTTALEGVGDSLFCDETPLREEVERSASLELYE